MTQGGALHTSARDRPFEPPPAALAVAEDLLGHLDRALPGRIVGFYIVGSACLGAFRADRSDVDFVALVPGRLATGEVRRLHTIHRRLWAAALARDVALRRRWPVVCNGSYLTPEALERSPLEVVPLAGHVAGRFAAGEPGFDVNPVTWHVLARHGYALRGPEPARLNIRADPVELRAWTIQNLNGYWRRWAARAGRPGAATLRARPRRFTAWGVLGAPRLHYTLATGEITTKEGAGRYALEAFAPEWRPLIDEALAFWRGTPPTAPYRRRPDLRRRAAAAFVVHVIESANRLALPSSGAIPRRNESPPDTPARAG
jgi:Domain of unknown function (DUF4111)